MRLHLQHGPIDLVIGAEGDRQAAFATAKARFETVLEELVHELPELRLPLTPEVPEPQGSIAQRMDAAVRPFQGEGYLTRMAAVAGSVAETVLQAMKQVSLTRAYVNNGGDIALHLTQGTSFEMAMAGHDGRDLGRLTVCFDDPIRGIATSGRHGRSFSLGIADSVTVLAPDAARADVAATLIANAVDVRADHPAVQRIPAYDLDEGSDLGNLPVVTNCGALGQSDITDALAAGHARAQNYTQRGVISGAALFLQDQLATTQTQQFSFFQRTPEHA